MAGFPRSTPTRPIVMILRAGFRRAETSPRVRAHSTSTSGMPARHLSSTPMEPGSTSTMSIRGRGNRPSSLTGSPTRRGAGTGPASGGAGRLTSRGAGSPITTAPGGIRPPTDGSGVGVPSGVPPGSTGPTAAGTSAGARSVGTPRGGGTAAGVGEATILPTVRATVPGIPPIRIRCLVNRDVMRSSVQVPRGAATPAAGSREYDPRGRGLHPTSSSTWRDGRGCRRWTAGPGRWSRNAISPAPTSAGSSGREVTRCEHKPVGPKWRSSLPSRW